jgi:hypothetical protein
VSGGVDIKGQKHERGTVAMIQDGAGTYPPSPRRWRVYCFAVRQVARRSAPTQHPRPARPYVEGIWHPIIDRTKPVAWLALIAIGGIVYFVVAVVVLHFLRPEYNPINHAVSNYAVGPYGYLMTAAFYVLALSVLALALGLFRIKALTNLSRSVMLLLGVASFGLVVMGIFPGDVHALHPPATITGVVHWTAAGISFLSIMIAAFLLSSFFKLDEQLQRFQRPCLILAWAMVGSLLLYGLLALVGWIGIGQRIYLAVCLLWLLVLAGWIWSFGRMERSR